MDQHPQPGNSNAPELHEMKRKRGRPRKDPSLKKRASARARAPVGHGVSENKSTESETIDFSNGGVLGQPVSGVIEASFDAGYLLNVRIGNSSSSYRGLVFRPGNFVPVTASNDVAPHAQMIKRNDIPFPLERQSQNSNGALVPSKGKHALPPSSFSHLNGRGSVVPVVLQPFNAFNASSPSDSSDKDVVAAEPLSVLLPFGSQSSNQFMTHKADQRHGRGVVQPGRLQITNDSCSEEKGEADSLTQVPAPVGQGSLQTSYTQHDTGGSSASFSRMGMSQRTSNISFSHGTQHP